MSPPRPAATIGRYAGCRATVHTAALGVGHAVGPVVLDTDVTASSHDTGAHQHVHPAGDGDYATAGSTGGPELAFLTTFPTYRLFLDVNVGGAGRTAAFTVEVPR